MDVWAINNKARWCSKLVMTSLILILNLEIGTSLDKFTTCNYNLQLQDTSIHQGILELGIRKSDSSGTRVSCDFEIDAGPGRHVMFYFLHAQLTPEGEQYDVACIELKDNVGNIQTTIEDFPMKVCFSTEIPMEDRVFATTGSRLSIRFYRNRGFSMAAGYQLIFTAFRQDSCRTSERKCNNGRCIAHEIVCNDYNPCGDYSDCPTGLEHLSTLALAGIIVLGILGGGTVIIAAAVCLQQGGRKYLGRQANDWSTTYQSNGDILEMHTEIVTDDALVTSRGAARNLQSVSEDGNDVSRPATQYSEIQTQDAVTKQTLDNQDESSYFHTGDPLNPSSPQDSITPSTLSSFPLTTETHLPDVFNSQEHIGNEIFDSDICVTNTKDGGIDTASASTAALLHVDYDNHAMVASDNDLLTDENKVLLTQTRPRQKGTASSASKTKHNKRAPPPPDYKVVMKQSERFKVHKPAR